MRGTKNTRSTFYSCVSQEERIPADHPLRLLRQRVDPLLKNLSGSFDALYAEPGRPSIPPEYLLRALSARKYYPHRNRLLVSLIVFLSLLALISCNDIVGVPATTSAKLIGKWDWIKSVTFVGELTPESEGYTQEFHFWVDSMFTLVKNDRLVFRNSYTVRRDKHPFIADTGDILIISDFDAWELRFQSYDTLTLSPLCFDCSFLMFTRIR